MASPWSAIAFVAGVAVATSAASAQPVVSPRQADPAPAKEVKPAAKPAAAKPAAAKPAAAKPSTTAKKSTPTKSTKSAKTTKSAKATKTTKSAKPVRSTKRSSAKKSAKAATPARSGARVASAVAVRSRGDNMPRGFQWPATPEMQAAGKACQADLDTLGVAWKPSTPEGRIVAPVEVTDGVFGGVKYTSKWRSPPHRLDCQLARALALVGRDLHAIGVREVRWGSIYRWSNVRAHGTTLPLLSRHALGLAMDIVEFVDDTGRVANVQQHYKAGDTLLAGVEQVINTSGKFRIMLTPQNDPTSHHDHFHIEANPDYAATAPTVSPSPAAPSPAAPSPAAPTSEPAGEAHGVAGDVRPRRTDADAR